MGLPNTASQTDTIDSDVKRLNTTLVQVRRISVNQKAALAAGPVSIDTIVSAIYVPFVSDFWPTITELKGKPQVLDRYYEQIGRRILVDPDDTNLTTDRVVLDGNRFAVSDPVQLQGSGTPPTGLVKGTNYFVFDKQGDGVSFKATLGGGKIDLTGAGSGAVWVEYRAIPDLNTLETALEAAIDEIITLIPVTTTTLEIRSQKFDKALAQGTTGLEEVTQTAVQTATLQTKLQDTTDTIDAPA